jgi:hypothetical protein
MEDWDFNSNPSVSTMPTLAKAELTESATPMLEIWDRMLEGLLQNGRLILDAIGYYAEYDLLIPDTERKFSEREKTELHPIVRVLMEAAVKSEMMRDGVLASTLKTLAKQPSLFSSGEIPASVQWEIANDYRRVDEKPGTFCMDIWGDSQTRCTYALETPTEANITKAAEAAYRRIEDNRSPGRPPNPANRVVAEGLSKIFRSSGQPIGRRREPTRMHDRKVIYMETSPFHDFLELVLDPLQRHLREHGLAPVTIDSIVRIAIEET